MLELFREYPRLEHGLPRVSIGSWPTPVYRAERFAAEMGLSTLFIKREDLSDSECGGNKVRGLEFLIADACRRGATTIVTVGAAGSHHVARTAWHGARHGLRTVAVILQQPMAEYVRQNLSAALRAGARIVPASIASILPKTAWEIVRPSYWASGRPAYFIAQGGTTPLACVGHVNAAFELREQCVRGECVEPDFVYLPMGSLGTAAGLILGFKLASMRTRVVGVVTSYRWYARKRRVLGLAHRTYELMRRIDDRVPKIAISDEDFDIVGEALGPGYGKFTEESVRLAVKLGVAEGIGLDGTYMAKTLDGMMRYVAQRGVSERVQMLWQTYDRIAIPGADLERSDGGALRRMLATPNQPLDGELQGLGTRVEKGGMGSGRSLDRP